MIRIFKNDTTKFVYIDQVAFGPSEDFTVTDNGDGTIDIFRVNSGEFEAKNLRWQTVRNKNGDDFASSADLITYLEDVFAPEEYYSAAEVEERLDPESSESPLALVAKTNSYNSLDDKPAFVQENTVTSLISDAINNLLDGAPAALDTLNEIALALADNDTELSALLLAISNETTARQQADTALQTQINNLPGGGGGASKDIIRNAGRFYVETNNRWITESDDVYGGNNQNFAESGGTGADPLVEWEHLGHILPAGTDLKQIYFDARANNSSVTDFEISVQLRKPSNPLAFTTGIDADGEMVNTEIYRGNFVELGWTGNMQDRRRKIIDLSGVGPLAEDQEISIYVKPIGVITARRYIYANYLIISEM